MSESESERGIVEETESSRNPEVIFSFRFSPQKFLSLAQLPICACSLAHVVSTRAASATNVVLESSLLNIYFYFSCSSLRRKKKNTPWTQNKIIVTEKEQSHLFSWIDSITGSHDEGIELGVSMERSQPKKKKKKKSVIRACFN